MNDTRQKIAENVADVRQRITDAARRGGRNADQVVLVAVTKYVDAEVARILPSVGCQHLGESRPQSLWLKVETLRDDPIHWHMIGHLQRNKIRRTVPLVSLIHSADNVRLLDALDAEAERIGRRARVLLEVNVSQDTEKHGFSATEAATLPTRLGDWAHLEICGLMAMSGRQSDAQGARSAFVQLRQLRDAMQRDCPDAVDLRHLSMGMSRDFEVAVEEGATIVRVGSALFEGALE